MKSGKLFGRCMEWHCCCALHWALLCIDRRESVGFYALDSASLVHAIQIRWVVSPALMAKCIIFPLSAWRRFASFNRFHCAAHSHMNMQSAHWKNFYVNLLKNYPFRFQIHQWVITYLMPSEIGILVFYLSISIRVLNHLLVHLKWKISRSFSRV